MSNDDFLCNKKYSVRTVAKECVLCTKMLTFFIYFAPFVAYTIKIQCIFYDFLRPFNYHYLNAPFYVSKNNVEADSVV